MPNQNPKKTDDLQRASKEYFAKVNTELKSAIDFEFTDEEQQIFVQLIQNTHDSSPDRIDQIRVKLLKIGYTEEQIEQVIDQLLGLSALRLIIKIFKNVPEDKLDKMVELSEKLSPMQSNAMVETVYKNHTGKDLAELSQELYEDTLDAYEKDISATWERIQTIVDEDKKDATEAKPNA